jgi:ketol-acid reductoisomerase
MSKISSEVIGRPYIKSENDTDNQKLIAINEMIRFHPIEIIGYDLRAAMTAMKKI